MSKVSQFFFLDHKKEKTTRSQNANYTLLIPNGLFRRYYEKKKIFTPGGLLFTKDCKEKSAALVMADTW